MAKQLGGGGATRTNVEFVTIDSPLGSGIFEEMSPSQRRWLAPQNIFREFGPDISLALVDADTMIRWDAPNLFDAANDDFSAVRGKNARWIYHDICAYRDCFRTYLYLGGTTSTPEW